MKNKKAKALLTLSLVSIMGLTATSCSLISGIFKPSSSTGGDTTDTNSTDTGSTDTNTGTNTPENELIVVGVSKKATFAAFESNKGVKENKNEEFIDKDQAYTVGDDNNFNVKPILEIINSNGDKVSQSEWKNDFLFDVQVKNGGTFAKADSSLYTVTDAKNCDIDFADEAVGKTFKIKVTPSGLDEQDAADPDFSQTITVDVVDGYNVYKAVELGYFDQRRGTAPDDEHNTGDNDNFVVRWDEFKESKGLTVGYNPASLILQDNISITKDDLPSTLFYKAEDLTGQPDADRSVGSFRDDCYFYSRVNNDAVTLNGNYFKLDYSSIPVVTRERGKTTAVGGVVSHAGVFRVRNGAITLKNLNITGNAKKATSDDDTIYGGGLILTKAGHYAQAVNAENVITRKCFITYMSESVEEGHTPVSFNVSKSIGTDNYNSFFYNWGGVVNVADSRFGGCGGPIIIQDHTRVPDGSDCEANNGFEIIGVPSYTTFKNCELNNLVAGSEAWFIQFNATALVPGIKALSDLYSQFGKSYVVNEAGQAAAMAAGTNPSFFNFIALNKSSDAQGITNNPVCGTVRIINDNGDQVFNYAQPDAALYAKATEIQTALMGAQAGTVSAEQLMALAAKYDIAFTDQASLVDGLTAAATEAGNIATAQATTHGILRAAQAKGAPVFQNGDGFAFYDEVHQFFHPLANAATGEHNPVANDDPFVTTGRGTNALYYNSMMLVFGTYSY